MAGLCNAIWGAPGKNKLQNLWRLSAYLSHREIKATPGVLPDYSVLLPTIPTRQLAQKQ